LIIKENKPPVGVMGMPWEKNFLVFRVSDPEKTGRPGGFGGRLPCWCSCQAKP